MAPLPKDLQDRRVEITGPTDAKMVINALNSGASLYMADFEDSNCPTWANTLEVGSRGLSRRAASCCMWCVAEADLRSCALWLSGQHTSRWTMKSP